MQRIFILIMLLAGFACSRNKTEILGLVEGGFDETITLERLDVNRTTVIDSVKIKKDGSFSFKTQIEEPELYILKNDHGDIVNLLLAPGERVSISTSSESFGSSYQVNGSEESEKIKLLVSHLDQTRKVQDSLLVLADSIGDPESPQTEIILNAYTQTIIKQKRFTIRYLIENMSSLSSVYALYQKYDEENLILGTEPDLQYFKAVADSLQIRHPNSSLTKSLLANIERREADWKETAHMNELLSMVDEVSGMLDLTIPDRDGNEVILSSFKGKVILVTFWASGNDASIQALLKLQSTYNQYHDRGFEVYAISLDNNKISWMQAIDFNEFKWINVSELSYPDSRANVLYNVTTLPSSFLINREGDILAKNLSGKTLETWLDNLI